jgi:hypothetical protein
MIFYRALLGEQKINWKFIDICVNRNFQMYIKIYLICVLLRNLQTEVFNLILFIKRRKI